MIRLPDWRARLAAYVAAEAAEPFAEGSRDCALFAAGAVLAMTGADPAAGFRGRYTTTRGGLRLLRRAGHADHVALAASLLPEVRPAFAATGDLVMVRWQGDPALGVVDGEWIVLRARPGLARLPLMAAETAFQVPTC